MLCHARKEQGSVMLDAGCQGKESLSGFLEEAWRLPIKGRWKGTSPKKRYKEQVQSSDSEKGCGKI